MYRLPGQGQVCATSIVEWTVRRLTGVHLTAHDRLMRSVARVFTDVSLSPTLACAATAHSF
jgi:hypothetical protein